jgi:hypothetical protein
MHLVAMQENRICVSIQIGGGLGQQLVLHDLASGVEFELPLEVHLFLSFVVFSPLLLAPKAAWKLFLVLKNPAMQLYW